MKKEDDPMFWQKEAKRYSQNAQYWHEKYIEALKQAAPIVYNMGDDGKLKKA